MRSGADNRPLWPPLRYTLPFSAAQAMDRPSKRRVWCARDSEATQLMMIVRAMALAGVLAVAAPAIAQREFRVYPSFEGDVAEAPLPPDYQVPGELVIGHMMFP